MLRCIIAFINVIQAERVCFLVTWLHIVGSRGKCKFSRAVNLAPTCITQIKFSMLTTFITNYLM